MELHDMMEELVTALENHTESDGHEFGIKAYDPVTGNADLRVVARDGQIYSFHVRVRDVTVYDAEPANAV